MLVFNGSREAGKIKHKKIARCVCDSKVDCRRSEFLQDYTVENVVEGGGSREKSRKNDRSTIDYL